MVQLAWQCVCRCQKHSRSAKRSERVLERRKNCGHRSAAGFDRAAYRIAVGNCGEQHTRRRRDGRELWCWCTKRRRGSIEDRKGDTGSNRRRHHGSDHLDVDAGDSEASQGLLHARRAGRVAGSARVDGDHVQGRHAAQNVAAWVSTRSTRVGLVAAQQRQADGRDP